MEESEVVGTGSKLEDVLNYVLTSEIPALYWLVERLALAIGVVLMFTAIMSIYRVRSLTGNYSMMSMQMADVSLQEIAAKVVASVFLTSFGLGQAIVSNTLLFQSFEPYSVDVLRSISCSAGDSVGCIHYELGIYNSGSWTEHAVNKTFFEFFTAVIAMLGTICYTMGWVSFSKLGGGSGQPQKGFMACCMQIIMGTLLMRPTETWLMFTGGS
ncbi:hypothetical protein [Vibrio agarivorans]|uniref:hypothetical protein n=1 Tax=Vibrio agarivorans TaxID=153622 RepID=UPI0025B5F63E|nr:hypothetical protein [Vibrio agarivorans]MDN3661092.1 hypothetical protein [Vibrio agarivorans]